MAKTKLQALQTYADGLKQRLASPVPERHNKSQSDREAYMQMLEIDLKKTQIMITRITG